MGLWDRGRLPAHPALEVVDEHVALGPLDGDVIVRRGGDLVVRGCVTGSLYVCRGGKAMILGRVDHDVHVFGGKVEVRGVVLGTVFDARGLVVLHEKAYIGRLDPPITIRARAGR